MSIRADWGYHHPIRFTEKGKPPMKLHPLALLVIVVSLILSACNLGAPAPQSEVNVATAAALTVEAALASPAAEDLPIMAATPTPGSPVAIDGTTAEPAATCNDQASILSWKRDGADYNKAEADKPLSPGKSFLITLDLKNTGNCLWTHQYKVFLDSGTPLTVENPMPTMQSGFQVKPGETFTLNMQFTAPTQPGSYESVFRLDDENGQRVLFFTILTAVGKEGSSTSGLSAPGELRYAYDCSGGVTRISITWQDKANNETGYRIYRGTNLIADLPAGTTTYDDIAPAPGSYQYIVAAYNSTGESTARLNVETANCK